MCILPFAVLSLTWKKKPLLISSPALNLLSPPPARSLLSPDPAGIYASFIVDQIIGPDASLEESLKWGIIINAFYLPGTFIGALVLDKLGPKKTMITGLLCQAAIGFGLAGGFGHLKNNIAGFAVIYGIFIA